MVKHAGSGPAAGDNPCADIAIAIVISNKIRSIIPVVENNDRFGPIIKFSIDLWFRYDARPTVFPEFGIKNQLLDEWHFDAIGSTS